ncbi:dynein regulatory complex subunit 2 [Phasianus colchicus]|uniref:Dynein regulatory complex subunit 2 n=1 Tax=Phasianus colchicus TaxID=9054 RepID=A0A669QDY7_PHACC|nr:dynein regulatory complex subunit 2 [Phasianus colchicus]XP_031464306.1 dynein regulatory complex subunit 2 [Phasianus colchicus]XP_031464307.1 dynein regulatory complex subunit 2 [Phasianus colchicus]
MPVKRQQRAAGPVSAEDELLLLQGHALAEEEAAKRKMEMLSRFLKDKLAQEQRSAALNLHKLHSQWRAVLREAKAQELHQDVAILSQTFARVMDSKDGVIESLVTDLEEAEAQHKRALSGHLQNVDRLLQLQRCRLRCMEEGCSAQLEDLQEEFEAERRSILEQHQRELRYLQDVAVAVEQNHAREEHEATLNFQSTRDEIKNKSLQEKQYTRLQLSGKLEGLWEQFQHAMQCYAEATEHRKLSFEALKVKDEKSSQEIEVQEKKLQKLQDAVLAAKARLAAHLHECEEQNQRMREQKEAALGQLQQLKSEMSRAQAKAHRSLAELTAQSGAALKALGKIVGKAERVLRLAELCRRMESEEEKVLPFYPSSLAEGEQDDAQRVLREAPTEPLAQTVQDYVGLERFWQRFNKVKLEELAVGQQRAALTHSNRRLRALLRRYLDGLTVNPDVMSKPNALLDVSNKSCTPRNCPQRSRDAPQPRSPPEQQGAAGPSVGLGAECQSQEVP